MHKINVPGRRKVLPITLLEDFTKYTFLGITHFLQRLKQGLNAAGM